MQIYFKSTFKYIRISNDILLFFKTLKHNIIVLII